MTGTATTGGTTETAGTGATTETTETSTTTELTIDDWKARARQWEQRAKDNIAAATKLRELEDEQKSETQKLTEQAAEATRAAEAAKAEALRWKVAAKFSVSEADAELFLTGTDEDTLTKQAQRLAERTTSNRKNGNKAPAEGTNTGNAGDKDMTRQIARDLFRRGE